MVFVRSTLSDQERSTIVWPVLRGIIPAEDFDQCAVHLTTRLFGGVRWILSLDFMGDDQENYLTPPDRVRCVVDLGTPRPSLAAWRSLNLDATVQGLVMEQRAQLAEEEGNASNVRSHLDDHGIDLAGVAPLNRIQNLLRVPPALQREIDRRMRRMSSVRFGRETSLLVLELRREGGAGGSTSTWKAMVIKPNLN